MNTPAVVEICVTSAASARAAADGGAHRLEVCEHLEVGGTTPSADLIGDCRRAVTVPLHVMVRPRGGDFCYSDDEFRLMAGEIEAARKLGADGIVLGILRRDRTIDVERTKELIGLARPLGVTFHRAFDEALDPVAAVEDVIRTGATRLLTSGQQADAVRGLPLIARLAAQTAGRLKLIAAAGVRPDNIRAIISRGRIGEIHVAASARKMPGGEVDADLVRKIVAAASLS